MVISSLLNNSIESISHDGTIRIQSEMVEGALDGRCGKLEITDNGTGLDAKDREFLFDPFYSGRQAGRGLGFGLPKCWRIVDQHNGRIEFDSRPGGPTTFTVLWPATETSGRRRDERHETISPRAIPEGIADDLVEERLEDTGYKIPRRRRKRSY